MAVIEVRSLSRANDLSLVALADLASAAAEAGLDHRVIGGQMVTLHLHLAGVQHQVSESEGVTTSWSARWSQRRLVDSPTPSVSHRRS